MVHTASSVKSSKEICVPWALCFLAGVVPLARTGLLCIDQVVGVIAQGFADDEGALPRGRGLVLAGYSLDQLEHKITLLEGSWLDLSAVVTS